MSPYLVQSDWPVYKSRAIFAVFNLETCAAPINFRVLWQTHFDGIQLNGLLVQVSTMHDCFLSPSTAYQRRLCAVEGRPVHACWWQGWRRRLMTVGDPSPPAVQYRVTQRQPTGWLGLTGRPSVLSASVMSSTVRHVGLVVIGYSTWRNCVLAGDSLISSVPCETT